MPAPRSVRLRVTLELLDEQGNTIIAAPSDTFVTNTKLSIIESHPPGPHLDADSNTVAQQAFQMCRDSYRRIVLAVTSKGQAA
jgi:hypothetical protein